MNHLRENPIGIEDVIQTAQKRIYSHLMSKWGENISLDGYGRCYMNKNRVEGERDSFVPEFYLKNNEYSSLLHLEGNKFFFMADSKWDSVGNFSYKTEVSVYFILNLDEIRPDSLHRDDANVISDCFDAVSRTYLGEFDVETDTKKVYEDFKVNGSDIDNVHPYLVFKFKTKDTRFKINRKHKSC